MLFDFFLAGALIAVVATGHFSLWIWLYNRTNATGWNRNTIKRTEKAIVLICGMLPLALVALETAPQSGANVSRTELADANSAQTDIPQANAPQANFERTHLAHWSAMLSPSTLGTKVYCVGVAAFAIALAPFWIADRPQFATAKDRFQLLEHEDLTQLQYPESNARKYIDGAHFRRMAKLPGNQIVSLQRNRKRLAIESLPPDLEGLRIAHLSDVHLTGQLSTRFYRLVVDWIQEQAPEMVVVSGDIVDYQQALPQLRPVFHGLSAPLGCYFILGNHDKRLKQPTEVCTSLCELDWTDLGVADALVHRGNASIQLIGNELPWFRRHVFHPGSQKELGPAPAKPFKMGVSHSPDQLAWGVESDCSLLLCGHTHGGQIRLPIAGPIVAPSWFGTRYASGVFVQKSTLMHVSRGLSGVHPFRWGCLPEATILELTALSS